MFAKRKLKRTLIKAIRFSRLFTALFLSLSSFIEAKVPRACNKLDRIQRKANITVRFLKQKARKTLRANIVTLETGNYLRAGANHFGSLWTRDFVYSIPGLLTLGRDGEITVRDHLSKMFLNLREDGLVPRLFDIPGNKGRTGSERRIISFMLDGRSPVALRSARLGGRFTKLDLEWDPTKIPNARELRDEALKLTDNEEQPLVAEHLGEHKTEAFDSNILAILGALQYVDQTQDLDWFNTHKEDILKVYQFYDDKFSKRSLIKQPKFSDWQDSVARNGHSFYINFLYWKIGNELLKYKDQYGDLLENYNINVSRLATIKYRLWNTYFHKRTGMFKTHLRQILRKRFGLEDQLFALETPEFYEGATVAIKYDYILSGEELRRYHYEKLKSSKLWKGSNYTHYDFDLPGLPTQGNYFFWDRSFYTNLTGIRRYHDKFIWSWLIGESAKIASIMGEPNKGEEILENFGSFASGNSEYISEIYTIGCQSVDESVTGILGITPRDERYIYKSEAPFSWGAAKLLEGIEFYEKAITE